MFELIKGYAANRYMWMPKFSKNELEGCLPNFGLRLSV